MVSLTTFPHGQHPGKLSSPALASSPNVADSKEWGPVSLSHPRAQLTSTHKTWASFTVFPSRGTGPAFLSATFGEGQGQFYHSHAPKGSPASCKWQGHIFLIIAIVRHTRERAVATLLLSHPQTMPALVWGQERFFHTCGPRAISYLLHVARGEGNEGNFFPTHAITW